MSNKRRGYAGDGGEKRSRRIKHLYLVLDDWTKGYSIHKIQADSFDSDSGYVGQHSSAARHQPPALRLECLVGTVPHSGMSFATLGTNVFTFMNQRHVMGSCHGGPPPQMRCNIQPRVGPGRLCRHHRQSSTAASTPICTTPGWMHHLYVHS